MPRRRSARAGRKTDFRTALKMARTEVELGPWLREFLEAPAAKTGVDIDHAGASTVSVPVQLAPKQLATEQLATEQLATGPQLSLQMKLPVEVAVAVAVEMSAGEFNPSELNSTLHTSHAGLS